MRFLEKATSDWQSLLALVLAMVVLFLNLWGPERFALNWPRVALVCGILLVTRIGKLRVPSLRVLLASIVALIALGHVAFPSRLPIDWQGLVLIAGAGFLFVLPQVVSGVPEFIESIKYKDTEIRLRREAESLSKQVSTAESLPVTPTSPTETETQREAAKIRAQDVSVERQIVEIATRDKNLSLIQLAIEIEKEIVSIHASFGYGNTPGRTPRNFQLSSTSLTVRQLAQQLQNGGVIKSELAEAVSQFWTVRNDVVHGRNVSNDVLDSALDSGLRVLRLLRSIPRPIYKVVKAKVALYFDEDCLHLNPDVHGVLLGSDQDSAASAIFPAGRNFVEGELVGWDWDLSMVVGRFFYKDPVTGKCKKGWDSSGLFVGSHLPVQENRPNITDKK